MHASTKSWSTRFAIGLAVCALLFKAAVPLLASASASLQGRTLVEVCTVYGVTMVALEDGHETSPLDHTGSHAAQAHCALTALLAFGAPNPSAPLLRLSGGASSVLALLDTFPGMAWDAAAGWAARLRHGPPVSL